MKKIKTLTTLLVVLFLSSSVLVSSTFAMGNLNDLFGNHKKHSNNHSTKNNRPGPAPEPISYVLILAGGATLAALRRWKTKRNLKNNNRSYQ